VACISLQLSAGRLIRLYLLMILAKRPGWCPGTADSGTTLANAWIEYGTVP